MSSLLDSEVKEILDLRSFLTFDLNEQTFAVPVESVVEIQDMTAITKIPNAATHMAGVQNLRGKILPVIDTRVKFGLPPVVDTVDTCIVVIDMEVEEEKVLVGALVDAVEEVISIPATEIQSSKSIEAKFDLEFVSGMFKQDEKFILMLDLNKVFALDDYNKVSVDNIKQA